MRLFMGLLVGVLIGAATRAVATDSRPVAKVEYLVASVAPSPEELQTELTQRGSQGWELVNQTRTALGEVLVFKRASAPTR